MKKKNVIGHIIMPKERMGSRIRKLQILPRLFCLLLAVLIWLIVVNVTDTNDQELPELTLPVSLEQTEI